MAQRTLDEKIEATKKLLAKYEQQKVTEAILNNIEPGDKVEFNYGRGDKAGTRSGTVIAVGEVQNRGKVAAIQTGEGLDIETVKVRVADITSNPSADGRQPSADDAGTDPLDAA